MIFVMVCIIIICMVKERRACGHCAENIAAAARSAYGVSKLNAEEGRPMAMTVIIISIVVVVIVSTGIVVAIVQQSLVRRCVHKDAGSTNAPSAALFANCTMQSSNKLGYATALPDPKTLYVRVDQRRVANFATCWASAGSPARRTFSVWASSHMRLAAPTSSTGSMPEERRPMITTVIVVIIMIMIVVILNTVIVAAIIVNPSLTHRCCLK